MQTTLLGLAIAIILALVAALVGPLLIDWGGYRSIFEAEASHLIGVDVRVTGAIDARLLPSPRLTLHDIEVGNGHGENPRPFARHRIRADAADARRMARHRTPPRRTAASISSSMPPAICRRRTSRFPSTRTRSPSSGSASRTAKSLSSTPPAASTVTFDKLWFNGDARSLIGPFKGEGAVTIGGELYPFRLTSGRYNDEGAIKLHVNVDPVSRPLSIEADGALTLGGGEPHFDGTLSFAKPVGIAASGGQRLTQPWRLERQAQAQCALGVDGAGRISIRLGRAGAQADRRRRFQIRQEPALRRRAVGPPDRSRPRAGGQRRQPAAAGRRHPRTGGTGRRRLPPDHSDFDRRRHRSDHARRQRGAEFARRHHQAMATAGIWIASNSARRASRKFVSAAILRSLPMASLSPGRRRSTPTIRKSWPPGWKAAARLRRKAAGAELAPIEPARRRDARQ